MSILEMKRQDMEELYHLLDMYERANGRKNTLSMGEMREEMEKKYALLTGRDIRQSRNPRGAGRKKKYTEEADARVMELYTGGLSLRRIAEKAGCSAGHVQDVVKRRKSACM